MAGQWVSGVRTGRSGATGSGGAGGAEQRSLARGGRKEGGGGDADEGGPGCQRLDNACAEALGRMGERKAGLPHCEIGGVRDGPCLAKRGRGGHGSSWAGPTGEADWAGVGLLSWVGLTLVVWAGFPSLLFPLLSIFQPHSNYLNSKLNLNSTLALKQIKQCTTMNAQTS